MQKGTRDLLRRCPITSARAKRCHHVVAARKKQRPQHAGRESSTSGGFGSQQQQRSGPNQTMQVTEPPSQFSEGVARQELRASAQATNSPRTLAELDRAAPLSEQQPLPEVSRERVLGVCLQTSLIVTACGFGLRWVAPLISPSANNPATADQTTSLLSWSLHVPSADHVAVALLTASAITVARLALLSVWQDFKLSTDASNTQALTPLQGPIDVALVSLLPAISEELLFRGALVPAISPDWRGVIISGAVFGVLHISGGRQAAFGAWATVVGWAYGLAFLATGDVVVPTVAHGLANAASASLWLSQRDKTDLTD